MLKLARPKLLFADRELPASIREFAKSEGIKVVDLLAAVKQEECAEFGHLDFSDDRIAYIMFTSGSTGVPKGVPMTHANYINFVENAMKLLPFKTGDVFSDYHDFGFDISIFYLFCCILAEGAFAPILKEEERLMPLKHLQENKVTVWSTTPASLFRIKSFAKEKDVDSSVRIFFCCGEPFRLELMEYSFRKMKIPHVYNFYGLTETGVENFWHECKVTDAETFKEMNFVPVGRPLPGNPVRISEEGELWIAGPQVTPAYLGNLSPDRFVLENGVRWFRSGDKAVEHKGVFFINGRLDSQVKFRGYRMELSDVEVNLRRIPGIEEAVCFIYQKNGREFLIAALKGDSALTPASIQNEMGALVPGHMVPNAFFYLDELPLNKNGKVDRPAIKEMYKG
jgi:acyl-coenzyme A synthetase/AMP-(fatty) acid ligase